MTYHKKRNIDEELSLKYQHKKWKLCSKKHKNSPSAQMCWKCGEMLK